MGITYPNDWNKDVETKVRLSAKAYYGKMPFNIEFYDAVFNSNKMACPHICIKLTNMKGKYMGNICLDKDDLREFVKHMKPAWYKPQ